MPGRGTKVGFPVWVRVGWVLTGLYRILPLGSGGLFLFVGVFFRVVSGFVGLKILYGKCFCYNYNNKSETRLPGDLEGLRCSKSEFVSWGLGVGEGYEGSRVWDVGWFYGWGDEISSALGGLIGYNGEPLFVGFFDVVRTSVGGFRYPSALSPSHNESPAP